MSHKYKHPDRKNLEKRVLVLVDKWAPLMDLGHFEIANVFHDDLRGEEADDLESTAAATTTAWEYRSASITWYLPAVAAMTDEGLEQVVVHELCHVLLAPLKEALKANTIKVEELATENVARAVLKARSNRG